MRLLLILPYSTYMYRFTSHTLLFLGYQGDYMATSKGIGHDVHFPLANGLRHGRGKRVWANGATYEGRRENRASLVG